MMMMTTMMLRDKKRCPHPPLPPYPFSGASPPPPPPISLCSGSVSALPTGTFFEKQTRRRRRLLDPLQCVFCICTLFCKSSSKKWTAQRSKYYAHFDTWQTDTRYQVVIWDNYVPPPVLLPPPIPLKTAPPTHSSTAAY